MLNAGAVVASGLVLGVSPVEHISGTSAKGKKYDFFSRKTQLFAGGSLVICSEMGDGPEDFPAAQQIGSNAVFQVERARMDGQSMILSGKW